MATSLRLQPGSTFAGVYRVRRLLGHGAMGAVYLVEERGSGALLALKVMSPELRADPKFVERFTQEAPLSRAVPSHNVVFVLTSGIDAASGLPYLVMEYLDGRDLARWIQGRPPLSMPEAVVVLAQLFDAIGAAHDVSIVHRDLKPENVLVVDRPGSPFVKVLDFGVAKVVREATMSRTDAGLGTPLWAAPEQGDQGKIQPSTDVWSLGLLTFFVLTGKMFWRAANDPGTSIYDLALELLHGPIPPASVRAFELGRGGRLPPGFDSWFAWCVTRDRAHRFQTARAAYTALAPLLGAPR